MQLDLTRDTLRLQCLGVNPFELTRVSLGVQSYVAVRVSVYFGTRILGDLVASRHVDRESDTHVGCIRGSLEHAHNLLEEPLARIALGSERVPIEFSSALDYFQILVYSPPGAVADFCGAFGVGYIDLEAMDTRETIEPMLGCPNLSVVGLRFVA